MLSIINVILRNCHNMLYYSSERDASKLGGCFDNSLVPSSLTEIIPECDVALLNLDTLSHFLI